MSKLQRPGGMVEVIVSPTDFVVRTEPRHEQATARRMLMPLQKRQVSWAKYRRVSSGWRPNASCAGFCIFVYNVRYASGRSFGTE
jgi:hypothetical protein